MIVPTRGQQAALDRVAACRLPAAVWWEWHDTCHLMKVESGSCRALYGCDMYPHDSSEFILRDEAGGLRRHSWHDYRAGRRRPGSARPGMTWRTVPLFWMHDYAAPPLDRPGLDPADEPTEEQMRRLRDAARGL